MKENLTSFEGKQAQRNLRDIVFASWTRGSNFDTYDTTARRV